MKTLYLLSVLTLLCLHITPSANGQGACPGFGINGVATSLESHSTHLNAVTVLPNGKFVSVGTYDDNTDTDFLVVMYNADGTVDHNFGPNGIRLYDVMQDHHSNDEALAVAVASDGHILVGGVSAGYGTIIKIDVEGKLVSTFGEAGVVQYGVLYSSVEDILVSTEGNIYGVGKAFHDVNIVFLELRVQAFDNNGDPLLSFSEDGKYSDTNLLIWHETVVKGAMQTDNKIVVTFTTPGSGDLVKWMLMRLNTDGTVDSNFGAAGLTEDPESSTSMVRDISLGGDGSIYLGGYSNLNSHVPSFPIVKKFKPNGGFDNSFNMTGSAIHIGFGNGGIVNGVSVDSNGKIFIAGGRGEEMAREFVFGAFTPEGETDNDFGTTADKLPNTSHGELLDFVKLQDGSFVACGYATGLDHSYGVLRKYKSDGSLDNNFNSAGASFVRFSGEGEAKRIAIQPDGKIVVAGSYLSDGSNTGIAFARFHPDGTPDQTFGNYGYIRHAISPRREFVKDLYIYPDGKILVGGVLNHQTSFDDYLILKLNPDGSLDETFGPNGNGYVSKHVGAYAKHNDLHQFTVDTQGRILIAGDANYNGGSYQNATVMRLLADGTNDPDFADNGVFSFNITVVNDYFKDVAVGTDGSIYAVGHGTVNVGAAVAKITDAGELDTNFGTAGIAYISWNDEQITIGTEIAIQSDGKIVVGCGVKSDNGNYYAVFLTRLLASGLLDDTYGNGGKVKPSIPAHNTNYLSGFIMHGEDMVTISGMASGGDSQFYLATIKNDGTLLNEPYRSAAFYTDANIALNNETGNVYAGIRLKDRDGMAIACLGATDTGNGTDCPGLETPTITSQGEVLHASEGDSYQWYLNGDALDGETNQSLVINPVNSGVYLVEVTIDDCTATSDDFDYLVTDVVAEQKTFLRVYPNPTAGVFYLESSQDLKDRAVSLHSLTGKQLMSYSGLSGSTLSLQSESIPAGLYLLSVTSKKGTEIIKIIKSK